MHSIGQVPRIRDFQTSLCYSFQIVSSCHLLRAYSSASSMCKYSTVSSGLKVLLPFFFLFFFVLPFLLFSFNILEQSSFRVSFVFEIDVSGFSLVARILLDVYFVYEITLFVFAAFFGFSFRS